MPKMHQNTLGDLSPRPPIRFFLNYNQHFANFKPKGFRVLFDITASVCFISKIYVYISALKMARPGNQHCANCIGTLSFRVDKQGSCNLQVL